MPLKARARFLCPAQIAILMSWFCGVTVFGLTAGCVIGPRAAAPKTDGASPSAALSTVTISHTERVGSSFRLEKLAYQLDGRTLMTAQTAGAASVEARRVVRVKLPVGEHKLAVRLTYRGNGYGVFSYLRKYRFHVYSEKKFQVVAGRELAVEVLVFERARKRLEKRLAVDFRVGWRRDSAVAPY